MTKDKDMPPALNSKEVKHIQKIIGKFDYYARSVNHTMLVVLGELATKQTVGTATSKVADGVVHFLNYAVTYPNAVIKYHASGMVLHVDSDASYLSVSKAWSRVRGYHYLSPPSLDQIKPPIHPPPLNGPLHAVSSIMKNIINCECEKFWF